MSFLLSAHLRTDAAAIAKASFQKTSESEVFRLGVKTGLCHFPYIVTYQLLSNGLKRRKIHRGVIGGHGLHYRRN